MWLALVIVLLQGIIIALQLYFVRTFGQYAPVLKAVHDENLVLRKYLAQRVNHPVDIHEGLPEREIEEVA